MLNYLLIGDNVKNLNLLLLISLLGCTGTRPTDLGFKNGQLVAGDNSKPNWVSSYLENKKDEHYVEPIVFQAPYKKVNAAIKRIVLAQSRTKLISEKNGYLYFECTSLIFRFVDDLEIYVDAVANKIHFKSASRMGHSDLGANLKRVEKIKFEFIQSGF